MYYATSWGRAGWRSSSERTATSAAGATRPGASCATSARGSAGTHRRRPTAFSSMPDRVSTASTGKGDEYYKCPYSGPMGTFDIQPTADQLEDAGSYILKKAALCRVPSRPSKGLAGTQTCPDCNGHVRVKTWAAEHRNTDTDVLCGMLTDKAGMPEVQDGSERVADKVRAYVPPFDKFQISVVDLGKGEKASVPPPGRPTPGTRVPGQGVVNSLTIARSSCGTWRPRRRWRRSRTTRRA